MPSIETILNKGFGDGTPWDRDPRRRAVLLWVLPTLVLVMVALGAVVVLGDSSSIGGLGPVGLVGVGAFALLLLTPSVLAWISASRKRRAPHASHPAPTHDLAHEVAPATSVVGRSPGRPPRPVGTTASRFLMVFAAAAVVAALALAAWSWGEYGEERSVGYVVSSPATCVLELADRPGGEAEHTVEQTRPPRRAECIPPEEGEKVYYDPATLEEVSSRGDDLVGVGLGVGVAVLFTVIGVMIWVSGRRRGSLRPGAGSSTHG